MQRYFYSSPLVSLFHSAVISGCHGNTLGTDYPKCNLTSDAFLVQIHELYEGCLKYSVWCPGYPELILN